MNNSVWKNGQIIYNEFHIDFSRPMDEQIDCLTEDLLQVQYANGYLLDIGWYPEYESAGEFIVQVIKIPDWDKPIYYNKCTRYEQLELILLQAIDKACRLSTQ